MLSRHDVFDLAWSAVFGLIGIVYPLVAVFCRRRFWRTVLIGWVALVAYVAFLSIGLPEIAEPFVPGAARELELHWVPEGPFVFVTAVLGWFYPLCGATVGLLTRRILEKFRARTTPNI